MIARIIALTLTLFGMGGAAVVNADNCCHLGWQCQTEKDWDDGYYAYRRNQCPASATIVQTVVQQPAAAGQVSDNCCGIDRQCHSEHDWIVGWHAFRLGQCQPPAIRVQTNVQQPAPASQVSDNCCGIDRQCHNEHDWIVGWHAFRTGQCGAMPRGGQSAPASVAGPIRIEGPADYVADTILGLQWLLTHAPKWYAYVTDVVQVIRVANVTGAFFDPVTGDVGTQHWRSPSGADLEPGQFPLIFHGEELATFIALFLVHEACHAHAYRSGTVDRCHDDHVPFGIAEALNAIDVKGYWAWW